MDTIVFDNIPFHLDPAELMDMLRIKAASGHMAEIERLAQAAYDIGKPKAMYKVAYIESKGEDTIATDGMVFTSRVLRVNVEKAHKVFPFIVTCGMELHEWAGSMDDLLQRFWADAIAEMALRSALQFLEKHLIEQYEFSRLARMNPGSLQDWPLREQRALFALLGDPQAVIGVRLTDSLLMVPTKTVSGLIFPTEESFASCQLCPREDCRGRRAPYDKDLYDRKYRSEAGPRPDRS
jgi:hypothetical protein